MPPREAEYKLSEIEPTRELDPAGLFAGRVTRANAERYLVGGPNAIGGVDDWALGRLSAVSKEDGMIKAAANPRFMQGYAICR